MNDLRNIPFGRPWITDEERQGVLRVLDGPILTHGPQGKAFETEFGEFLGDGAHCLTVSSCMAALHLSYIHYGIGPGDEVIVPAQTHVATAHAVEWVGARPVFVDCEPESGNLAVDGIVAAITERTKAISVVHFVGIPCDMPAIMGVAEQHGLVVIEDCATAVGTRHSGKHVGLFGNVGCFSFYPVKHITTGEGGMFVTRHGDVHKSVHRLRAFGVDRTHDERTLPGMYDVPVLGLNYRMSEVQAALGRTQLSRFSDNLEQRRENFDLLKGALTDLREIHIVDNHDTDASSSYYCLVLVLDGSLRGRRNQIVGRLNAAGVGTSVYYPQPVPRMGYYKDRYNCEDAQYPNAIEISEQSFALPVGPHVNKEDIEYMVDHLHAVLAGVMQ